MFLFFFCCCFFVFFFRPDHKPITKTLSTSHHCGKLPSPSNQTWCTASAPQSLNKAAVKDSDPTSQSSSLHTCIPRPCTFIPRFIWSPGRWSSSDAFGKAFLLEEKGEIFFFCLFCSFCFFLFVCFFVFIPFLGLLPTHMEVPRLVV